MHNEAAHVHELHQRLSLQRGVSFDWVVVDDGSTDATRELLDTLGFPTPKVIEHANAGGLIAGSAYLAWKFGVEETLSSPQGGNYSHVMKLDADVSLPEDYLKRAVNTFTAGIGIVGGVLTSLGDREQIHHVPGPFKLYSRRAYGELAQLPPAIGFDVLDEVLLRSRGLETVVLRNERVQLRRAIGASEGQIHGRYRNGRVCRWTGYYLPYFLLHVVRYCARRPIVVGSLAMLAGYGLAGHGPYERSLRMLHARSQRAKLRAAARHPVKWIRQTYFY